MAFQQSYFLACRLAPRNASAASGACILDKFGNHIILYQCEATGARPLRERPTPPAVPVATHQGEHRSIPHDKATISVANVYISDFQWPEGVVEEKRIKALGVIEILPKPWCYPGKHTPRMGWSAGGIGRSVLGTVPVEEDGKAFFEAPVECEVYFRVIDEDGLAIQSVMNKKGKDIPISAITATNSDGEPEDARRKPTTNSKSGHLGSAPGSA